MISSLRASLFSSSFQNDQNFQIEDIAAIKIQRVWKAYALAEPFIPIAREAVRAIKDNSFSRLEKAEFGKATVYLAPKFVLKAFGRPVFLRESNSQIVRELCRRNNYKHLNVPKGRLHSNFWIEERLPMPLKSLEDYIYFYGKNRENFTSAVAEFTSLLFQGALPYITGLWQESPFNSFTDVPYIRFDNIILYLNSEGEGVIGLPDLENFEKERYKTERICKQCILCFPYHFDVIIAEAEKFDAGVRALEDKLRKCERAALARFEIAYDHHLSFLLRKKRDSKLGVNFKSSITNYAPAIVNFYTIAYSFLPKVRETNLAKNLQEQFSRINAQELQNYLNYQFEIIGYFLTQVKVAMFYENSSKGISEYVKERFSSHTEELCVCLVNKAEKFFSLDEEEKIKWRKSLDLFLFSEDQIPFLDLFCVSFEELSSHVSGLISGLLADKQVANGSTSRSLDESEDVHGLLPLRNISFTRSSTRYHQFQKKAFLTLKEICFIEIRDLQRCLDILLDTLLKYYQESGEVSFYFSGSVQNLPNCILT